MVIVCLLFSSISSSCRFDSRVIIKDGVVSVIITICGCVAHALNNVKDLLQPTILFELYQILQLVVTRYIKEGRGQTAI